MLAIRPILKGQEVSIVVLQEIEPKIPDVGLHRTVGTIIIVEDRGEVDLLILVGFAGGQLQQPLLLLTTRVARLVVAIHVIQRILFTLQALIGSIPGS